ncbi:hypothetical protein D6E03_09370, partial [Moraxella catarrhalis]
MVTAFVSEDGSMDQSDIADYVATSIVDPISRVEGVGGTNETVENSVTQIIEQQMKGIDGLMYMSSNSSAAGSASVTLTFEN